MVMNPTPLLEAIALGNFLPRRFTQGLRRQVVALERLNDNSAPAYGSPTRKVRELILRAALE